MKHTKRFLLLILCILMVVTTMPLSNAFAANGTEIYNNVKALLQPYFNIDIFSDTDEDNEVLGLYTYFFELQDTEFSNLNDQEVIQYCNSMTESDLVKYMQSAWTEYFVGSIDTGESLTDLETATLNSLTDEINLINSTQETLKDQLEAARKNNQDTTSYENSIAANEARLKEITAQRDELSKKAEKYKNSGTDKKIEEGQKKVDAAMDKVYKAQEDRQKALEKAEEDAKAQLIADRSNYKAPEPSSYTMFSTMGTNMYAVMIRNGNTTPDTGDIAFFEVTYKDNGGVVRREFFNPEEAYKKSQEIATKAASQAASGDPASIAAKATAAAFTMGDETGSVSKVFTPQATEMFMFETQKPISSTDPFVSFSYMTAKDCKKFEWTVNRLDIVSLDKVYGWENVGYFCDQPYVNYSGTRYVSLGANKAIGEQGVKQAGTTTDMNSVPGDTRYIIAGNSHQYYDTATIDKKTVNSGRLINIKDTINTYENTKTYLMNITLADINYGGVEAYNTDYANNVLSLCESLNAEINYTDMDGVVRTVYYPVMANSIAYYMENIKDTTNPRNAAYNKPHDLNTAISFAQQGENIPFKIDIPECLNLNFINFYYRDNLTKKTEYFKNLNKFSGSAARADQYITDNNDTISIAGIQFWDFSAVMLRSKDANGKDTGKRGFNKEIYLDTKADQPNINPQIVGDCTYFYKHGTPSGMTIAPKQSFSFSNPLTGISSSDDYNNYIKRQAGMTGAVTYDLSGSLTLYATAKEEAKSRGNVEMIVPQTGLSGDGWYAMEISTDDMSLASTTADAYVAIKYQPTGAASGEFKTTAGISIADSAANYYGYWAGAEAKKLTQKAPASDYKAINAAYRYGVGAGNKMTVIFQLKDVQLSQFHSVIFSLDAAVDDDWQIKDFRIFPISGLTERTVEECEMTNFNKVFANRIYKRSAIPSGSSMLKSGEDLQLLLMRGQTSEYTFGENGEEQIEVNKNRADYIFDCLNDGKMSLETASQEMGFMDTIKTYTVNVEVGMNEEYGTVYDSCGSSNYFYFQLEFENGNSSYVLANQQLSADGFRSGQTETFTISTNMDYGALQAINIVPDSTYEFADPTDKLCITSITVTRGSNSGIRKQWKVDYVGWISVQFSDTGGDDEPQKAQSTEQLIQTFQVSSEALAVALEFEMAIGESGKTAANEDYGQFIGNLTADIQYQTMSGGTKTLADVQVVKAMYDYYNHGALIDDDSMCYMSDEDMMFRPYKTDRFEVEISDFKSLNSIKFYASSDGPKCLNITAITVSVIASSGRLAINKNDEYQRKYNKPTVYLTCNSGDAVKFVTPGSDADKQWVRIDQTVKFNTNEVTEVVDTEDSMNIISEVPQSKNDELNFFFEIDYNNGSTMPVTGDSTYEVQLTYEYSIQGNPDNAGSTYDMKSIVNMKPNTDQSGFYAVNQGAARFMQLKSAKLEMSSSKNSKAKCSLKGGKMIVQHTRSGVVIDTMELAFSGSSFTPNYSITSFSGQFIPVRDTGEKQIVTLQLTSNSKAYALKAKEQDVAVAFRYKSSKDVSGGSNLYTSRYVYATAAGATSIRGGSVLTFQFDEPFVKDVSDIIIMPTGGLHVMTSAAYMINETAKSEKDITINNYYSFPKGCDAAVGGGRMYRSQGDYVRDASGNLLMTDGNYIENNGYGAYLNTNNVRELDVEIVNGTLKSGAAAPLRADMEIYYDQAGEKSGTVVCSKFIDVQNYLTDPGETTFVSGATQHLKFLIPGYGNIRSIKLIPRNETGTGCWKVNTISVNSYACTETGVVPTDVQTITINSENDTEEHIAYEAEGGYQYSLANLSVSATVKYSDAQLNGYEVSLPNTEYPKGKEYVAAVPAGQTITVEPIVNGTILVGNKVDYYVHEVTGGGVSTVDTSMYKINSDNSGITFTAPANDTAANKEYRITVASIECPSEKMTIKVVVAPGVPQEKGEYSVEAGEPAE